MWFRYFAMLCQSTNSVDIQPRHRYDQFMHLTVINTILSPSSLIVQSGKYFLKKQISSIAIIMISTYCNNFFGVKFWYQWFRLFILFYQSLFVRSLVITIISGQILFISDIKRTNFSSRNWEPTCRSEIWTNL